MPLQLLGSSGDLSPEDLEDHRAFAEAMLAESRSGMTGATRRGAWAGWMALGLLAAGVLVIFVAGVVVGRVTA